MSKRKEGCEQFLPGLSSSSFSTSSSMTTCLVPSLCFALFLTGSGPRRPLPSADSAIPFLFPSKEPMSTCSTFTTPLPISPTSPLPTSPAPVRVTTNLGLDKYIHLNTIQAFILTQIMEQPSKKGQVLRIISKNTYTICSSSSFSFFLCVSWGPAFLYPPPPYTPTSPSFSTHLIFSVLSSLLWLIMALRSTSFSLALRARGLDTSADEVTTFTPPPLGTARFSAATVATEEKKKGGGVRIINPSEARYVK